MSDSEGSPIPIPESHLDRILDVIAAAWTEKTKETYGSGFETTNYSLRVLMFK
jgi:hypothetical protein